jgi:hypothetical protein
MLCWCPVLMLRAYCRCHVLALWALYRNSLLTISKLICNEPAQAQHNAYATRA